MTTQAPQTRIDTFQDILDALERHPELQQALWRHMATPRLLDLPALVEELIKGQARTEAEISRLHERQDRMESRQDHMESRQDRMESRQDRMETDIQEIKKDLSQLNTKVDHLTGNVNRLIGTDYERRAANVVRRRTKHSLCLASPQIIHLANDTHRNAATQIADQAEAENLLDENEAEDLESIDLIILDQETGNYAAGEISITLDADDAIKAHRRAALLATATGRQATPILAGAVALNECLEAAQRLNVAVITIPDASAQETKSSN